MNRRVSPRSTQLAVFLVVCSAVLFSGCGLLSGDDLQELRELDEAALRYPDVAELSAVERPSERALTGELSGWIGSRFGAGDDEQQILSFYRRSLTDLGWVAGGGPRHGSPSQREHLVETWSKGRFVLRFSVQRREGFFAISPDLQNAYRTVFEVRIFAA